MRKGTLFVNAAAAALLALAAVLFLAWSRTTLLDLSFQTGWLLCAGVGALALSWWFPRLEAPRLSRRLRLHLLGGWLLAAVFAVHVDLRAPVGWVETILFVLFALLLTSTVAGTMIVRRVTEATEREGSDAGSIDRWLPIHVSLTYSLFGAALFHGVFTHAHGLMAHLFLHG